MGLAERRAIKDFQDNHLPKLQAEIHAAAGFPVPGDTSDRTKTAIELMEKSL